MADMNKETLTDDQGRTKKLCEFADFKELVKQVIVLKSKIESLKKPSKEVKADG